MTNPKAVLVDDDAQQVIEAGAAITEAGFDLTTFVDAESMLAFLEGDPQLVDLFVLDRKLPMRSGEAKADELGDALFEQVRTVYPDARILVFSGYTDFDHAQALMEGSGFVLQNGSTRIDRVTVLKKTQFDKFERHLGELRGVISAFDAIEISADTHLNVLDKRVLRRIGLHYQASSVQARLLTGGLTSARVWQCTMTTPDGAIAEVVAKQGKSVPAVGGLQDLLPREHIARRIELIQGLMFSKIVSVLQLAGNTPTSLMDLLGSNDHTASEQLRMLAQNLIVLERSAVTSCLISDLVEPLISWTDLQANLELHGVDVPSPDLWIRTTSIMSHGDLHPGNVLVCDDRPVIIDSDGNEFASSLLDPLTLYMSTLAHPDSPIASSEWPSDVDIQSSFGLEDFGSSSNNPEWFTAVIDWVRSRQTSPREYWAIALAYAARQLKFPDVLENERVLARVTAIAQKASNELREV